MGEPTTGGFKLPSHARDIHRRQRSMKSSTMVCNLISSNFSLSQSHQSCIKLLLMQTEHFLMLHNKSIQLHFLLSSTSKRRAAFEAVMKCICEFCLVPLKTETICFSVAAHGESAAVLKHTFCYHQ